MKRIKYLEFLPIIVISFFLFRLLNEKFFLTGLLGEIVRMCTPFFWALAIAYVANIAMMKFEKKFKLSRTLSLILSYLLVFLILGLLFSVVIPILVKTIPNLVNNSGAYAESFNKWYEQNIAARLGESSGKYGVDINKMVIGKMQDILKLISDLLQGLVSGIGKLAVSITTGLIQFFIGLVISVYVLSDKERFFANTRKFFTAFCGRRFTNKAVEIVNDADEIFGNYLIAKSLDSLIIGIIAIIGFSILRLEYAILFGIIIGVTNMIPYFGPMIGAVPVILITLVISPIQALWSAIFILVLQQVDGNIIGPKIVGEKVGIPALWGVVSVTIGGTLFGFMGMLLGTPIFTLFRKIILDVQDRKLIKMDYGTEQGEEEPEEPKRRKKIKFNFNTKQKADKQ